MENEEKKLAVKEHGRVPKKFSVTRGMIFLADMTYAIGYQYLREARIIGALHSCQIQPSALVISRRIDSGMDNIADTVLTSKKFELFAKRESKPASESTLRWISNVIKKQERA